MTNPTGTPPATSVHPIEKESFRLLAERVDLSAFSDDVAAVIGRVIHATADLDYAATMVLDHGAVAAGISAIRERRPIVCDVEMVRAGITAVPTTCLLPSIGAQPDGSPTRSALAIRQAAARWPEGAVFVIGCAPTALFELVRLVEHEGLAPALVVGVPVGFVGAAESKAELRRLSATRLGGLPAISNVGEKGGSSTAAAVINALVRLAGTGP